MSEPLERRGWVRQLAIVGAVLALLGIGLAGGLFVASAGAPTPDPGPGAVDIGFSQDMSTHHEQAIQMASWARDHTTDVAVKQLAYDIEATQTQQVGRLQGWLELWSAPAAATGPYMAWMADSHGMTGMGVTRMPGMATSEELQGMRALSGQAFDVRFLQLMLRHHQGGSAMLQYAADRASTVAVRNIAAQMLSSQTAEADLITSMLAERGAQPIPL